MWVIVVKSGKIFIFGKSLGLASKNQSDAPVAWRIHLQNGFEGPDTATFSLAATARRNRSISIFHKPGLRKMSNDLSRKSLGK